MTALPAGFVKICGVTTVDDARAAADAGATAIGLNLWPRSPRHVSWDEALRIAGAVRGRVEVVAVTVDMPRGELERVVAELRPDRVQLHGEEPDELVQALQPLAYKAVGLASGADVARALSAPGCCVLVDARDELLRGGTGRGAPAALAAQVCRARPTVLAGGLGPDNVARVIAALAPSGVDAASGVERAPGRKDHELVRRFVAAAKGAFGAVARS